VGELKWYKRDPRAALVGMANLTLEERGAYNTILDLIYCHDGGLPDDVRAVAHQMQIDLRTWKRLRARLLGLGKLYLQNGQLRNDRADQEVRSAELRYRSSANAAVISHIKRGHRVRKFNGIDSAGASAAVNANHNHIERKKLSDD
jgi:uncharacterized protein YdaU (DUF1376 family)